MALSIGILILVSYFTLNNYFIALQKSKMEVLHRLMAIARTGALLVDAEKHEAIARRYTKKNEIQTIEQDSNYLELHTILKLVKSENQLETALYTIIFYPGDSTFHFIVTSSEEPYFRHTYRNYPKPLLENQETGGTLDSYQDENGQWLSAFSPIKNKDGKVVALLEADENFEMFARRARQQLWQNAFISVLIVIPFGLLLYHYFARTFKKQEDDQQVVLQQKQEIEEQNEKIRTQSEWIELQNENLEIKVQERTTELQMTNEQLANFLYHSSHDVQAPIATLKGLYQLVTLELATDVGKDYLKRMETTIMRLEKIVKTIQRVHYIKTLPINITPIKIAEIVNRVFNSLPHRGTSLEMITDTTNDLQADSELMEFMMAELFKNAIQFNRHLNHLKITIEVRTEEERICICVRNDGEVLSPEARANLFVMFNRSHENSEGMGLGLYIASVCAQRLKGKLVFDDNASEVAFLIWLPH